MSYLDHSPDLHSTDQEAVETPFVIVLHEKDRKSSGYFRPEATVTLRSALRTSGLLLALPPDEVKSLLLMLTFVTPNGWCQPAVQQLADAMRVSEAKARARMQRLQDFGWQGQPLVTEIKRGSGMDGFALSPAVASVQGAAESVVETAPALPPSSRDVIIARSRALYARPRAEVEAEIAERMGWKEVGDGPEAQIRRRLLNVAGLTRDQVDLLLERHPHERIQRQLDWLPHRNAKSPARFLMAAVENDYDPPPGIRSQQSPARAEGQQAGVPPSAPPDQDPDASERGTTESECGTAGFVSQRQATELEMPEPSAAHDQ